MDLLKIILSALIPFFIEIYKGFKLPNDNKEDEKPHKSIHVKIIERIQASKILVSTIIVFFAMSLMVNYMSIKKIAKIVNTKPSAVSASTGLPPVGSPNPPSLPAPIAVVTPATNQEINDLVSQRLESIYGKCTINCNPKSPP